MSTAVVAVGETGDKTRPDTYDDDGGEHSRASVFFVTLVAFFLAEMGDKTQVATVMLAALSAALAAVVASMTLGTLVANVPVVFAGRIASAKIPFRLIRSVAATLFALIGLWVLVQGVPAGGS